jgi:uncharacterized membrane protein
VRYAIIARYACGKRRVLIIDFLHISDLLAAIASICVFAGQAAFLHYKDRRHPGYTMETFLDRARGAWIERVMAQKEGILAVQAMRNQIMAASFFASTAILLIVGTLTLSAQGDKLTATWGLLSPFGTIDERVWLAKLMFLLIDLLLGFGFFAQVIRLLSHVSLLVATPADAIEPWQVRALLLQAGQYNRRGLRCYYYAFPLLFWLFGPIFFFGSSVALAAIMTMLHRAPTNAQGPGVRG